MDKKSKLETLLDEEGLTLEEFMEQAVYDGDCLGICMNKDCDAICSCEPDASGNWCEECQTNSVTSGLILAGVI